MAAHRIPSSHAPLTRTLPMAALLVMASMFMNAAAAETKKDSNAATPKTPALECIGSYNEEIQGFEQYGHYVFLNQGCTLRVLDIAAPARPAEIAWLRRDYEIKSLALKWPALYVGSSIYDVTDPAHPRFRADLSEGGEDLTVLGNYLVGESQDQKVINYAIYDIQNPLHPLKRYEGDRYVFTDPTFIPKFFATDGSRIFEATSAFEEDEEEDSDFWVMAIRDVTSSATTLGRLRIPRVEEEGIHLQIRRGKLVAGDAKSTTIPLTTVSPDSAVWYYDRDGLIVLQKGQLKKHSSKEPFAVKREKEQMLRFYTSAEGTSPTLRGTYGGHPGAVQFKIAGKRGYLIDNDGGLQILEMADPAHPRQLGRLVELGEEPVIRAVDDDLVFLSGKEPGLLVYDCSNPASPVLRGTYPQASGPISIQGRRAYVAAGEEGLQILDITKPNAIRPLGHYPTPKPARDLATSGSLVYVLMPGELHVVDAANPAQPRLVGKTTFEMQGDYDCLKDGDPMLLKKLGPALYAIQLGNSTHLSIAACQVFDISNPAQPRPMPQQITAEAPDDSASGDTPAVIAPPPAPPTPTTGCYLCLPSGFHRDRSWDSINNYRMEVYDLSNPLAPAYAGSTSALETDDRAGLFKNIIYLADDEGGLVMLRPAK